MISSSSTAVSSNCKPSYPLYRVVVGYMPSWKGDLESIDYDKLTHINYAFYSPDQEGMILPVGALKGVDSCNDLRLQRLVQFAHKKKVKVSLSIGGANEKNFEVFTLHPDRCNRFYSEIKRVVKLYNLDGIDLDWEFPTTSQQGIAFKELLLGLRRTLDSIREGLLLTAAVGATSVSTSYISGKALEPCDWINLMSYDLTGAWADTEIGPTAPKSFLISAIELWKNKGVELAQIVLGIPFYGVSFTTKSGKMIDADSISYKDLNDLFELDHTCVANSIAVAEGIQLFFWDSPQFVAEKTIYALSQKMRGVMIWELTQDLFIGSLSLLNAIWQEMQTVTSEIEKLK